jgi:NADPH-dependent curcumin reductase CurA
MTEPLNRQFRLVARPVGMVKASDFELTTGPVPEPAAGDVLVQVLYISLDPAMRGWMNEGRSYIRPVRLGEVMRATGLGRVIASNDPGFRAGDIITGFTGVQEYAALPARHVTRVEPRLELPHYLGVLGASGMTAYFGLLDIGQPRSGETVVVSAAAGAVGSVVGQIARIKGCRVIGIAGGADKCRALIEEFGFDAAIDYKTEDVRRKLREHCPNGIDVYFDNVGGTILEAALANLARKARVVLCGAIAQYNTTRDELTGPRNYMSLLVNRARMEGFLVYDYAAQFAAAMEEVTGWLAAGRLEAHEEIVAGLENFPQALLRLFRGENLGKLLLEVA